MKKNIIFLYIVFLNQAYSKTYGPDEIEQILLSKNGEVVGAIERQDAAHRKTGYLFRSFLPKVDLEAGRERFDTGPYKGLEQPYGSLSVSVNVFNSFRDSYENRARSGNYALAESEKDEVSADELFKARESYWKVVFNNEVLIILQEAVKLNDRNLGSAIKRMGSGVATITDRIDFEQNALNLKQQSELARLELINSKNSLRALIGKSLQEDFGVLDKIEHVHNNNDLDLEFDPSKHREVRKYNSFEKTYSALTKKEGLWWAPKVDIYAAASHFTSKDRDYISASQRDDYTVGVRLNMAVFDGGESFQGARSYAAERRGAEAQAMQRTMELEADWENAKRALSLSHDLIHVSEENAKKAGKYLEQIISEYGRGIKNSPDVLQASQRYIDSKKNEAESRLNYKLNLARLKNISGN